MPDFCSNQEEADTKMFLRVQHASSQSWRKYIIHTPDTVVFIIALSCLQFIDGEIPEGLDYSIEDLMNSLPGLHSFTACDSISAFASRGKVKALKVMMTSTRVVCLFKNLGQSWESQDEALKDLEIFTCRLYGSSQDNVDLARCKMYCAKHGKIALTDLPACL